MKSRISLESGRGCQTDQTHSFDVPLIGTQWQPETKDGGIWVDDPRIPKSQILPTYSGCKSRIFPAVREGQVEE